MARPEKQHPVHRLNLELPAPLYQRVVEMRDALGAASMTEVLRHALGLFGRFHRAVNSGSKFFIKDSDGVMRELVVPGITPLDDPKQEGA